MALSIRLEGIDKKNEKARIFSDGFLVGEGRVFGPGGTERAYIYEIAERHKLDWKPFGLLFKDYSKKFLDIPYKKCTLSDLDSLPSNQRIELRCGLESEFVFDQKDIEWLIDFSKTLIKNIKEVDQFDIIEKKASLLKPPGNLHDFLNDYEYKCYEVWGLLHGLLAICEKALELGVNLRVVK